MQPAPHHHTGTPDQLHAERALVTIATVYGAERQHLTQRIPVDAFTDPTTRHYWQRLTDCNHTHLTPCPHLDGQEPAGLDDTLERDPTTCGAILLRDEIDGLYDAPRYTLQVLANHQITLAERAHLERLDNGHNPIDSSRQLEHDLARLWHSIR